ncbi:NAD(P)H-hydrate dehydratase [Motilibacter deserti]|uniref:ADP-dependent (S)-NAD(P)H-hydrate dehydratase n=1 Tax=Motilibacter deserti TaxID=2714956 RepID=A0ABX0GUD9_9ACTN|nr:NAD(P)H-hydrate dehydratase [Motilibacter deserti]NHC14170.1 NAD(P)H-hydrate dehydratase [Motilibacter deserti]
MSDAVVVTSGVLREWPLPAPGEDKESRGRTLIVGGSTRTPGAVLLAAEAALRCGAGKLQVATVASLAPHLAVALPEALVLPLPETAGGGIAPHAADAVLELAADAAAVLLGPGMVGEDDTVDLVGRVLAQAPCSVVLDALAVAVVEEGRPGLQDTAERAVLTPNNTELALMLGADRERVDRDVRGAALEAARRTSAVVTSGGSESWTAHPDGRTWRDESGGSGLGVSGSGDVHAGVVVGLAARGAGPAQAAVWGAHLHKRAGDRLAASIGKLGFLARELPAEIPRVLAEIEV